MESSPLGETVPPENVQLGLSAPGQTMPLPPRTQHFEDWVAFVRRCNAQNVKPSDIRAELTKHGLHADDVNELMRSTNAAPDGFLQGAPSAPPVPPPDSQRFEDWIVYARQCAAANGMRTGEIRAELLKHGLHQEDASDLANQAMMSYATFSADPSATGAAPTGDSGNEAFHGLLWFFGGLAFSIIGFMFASGAGGGRYIIATGPMLYGLIKMFRGSSRG